MKIGYARVSTAGQELGRQILALQEYGCEAIFQEKISGSTTKRPELDSLLERVRPGDTVVVPKIDRLGRSLRHLVDVVSKLKAQNVNFVSLGDNIDLKSPQGMLMFHMMGAFAEFERSMIRERVVDGIKFAKTKGKVGGRKRVVDVHKVLEYFEQGMCQSDIARMMNCSRQNIHLILNASNEIAENGRMLTKSERKQTIAN